MSTFAVTVETINQIWPHPNADRLALASVEGMSFQFVVGKDSYAPGDKVVYFPVDSLLPDFIIEKMDLAGKLTGPQKNRVKTVKLRGEISQGLVARPEVLLDEGWEQIPDLTEHLGVTKYEALAVFTSKGVLLPLPDGVSVYDIEGADRFDHQLKSLLSQPVVITEKLEGTNWSLTVLKNEVWVSQRNYTIKELEGETHLFWDVARKDGWIDLAKSYAAACGNVPVTLRGELVGPGIQKNIYGLKSPRVFLFDVMVNGVYLDAAGFAEFVGLLNGQQQQAVPVLSTGKKLEDWLDGRSVQMASNGKSALNPSTRREGIVIKPVREQRDLRIGRLILKMRSPDYLAKSDL